MPQVDIKQLYFPKKYLFELLDLCKKYVPTAEIWAYGSRLTGKAHEASDLDIVLRNREDLTKSTEGWLDLKDAITQSTIPILIDVHSWNLLPSNFHENIKQNYCILHIVNENIPRLGLPEFSEE